MTEKSSKRIKDPIYGVITIDDKIIEDLISTKEFVRLSRIKQLSTAENIYPSATHTRYTHSLGVYYLMKLFLNNLNPEISKQTRIAALCSALLHDIGHGPYSHLFEEITDIDHEDISRMIISSKNTEIGKILFEYSSTLQEEIVKILNGEHENMFLNQLISSQLDVDRIDYLLRDSYHSGSFYGKVDFQWLIKNSRIIEDRLVFQERALNVVETALLSRYQLNRSLYKNPKCIAHSQKLVNFLKLLKTSKDSLKYDYKNINFILNDNNKLNESDLSTFLKLDDFTIIEWIKEAINEQDKNISSLALDVLNKRSYEITENKNESNETFKQRNFILYSEEKPKDSVFILSHTGKLIKLSEISKIISSLKGKDLLEFDIHLK